MHSITTHVCKLHYTRHVQMSSKKPTQNLREKQHTSEHQRANVRTCDNNVGTFFEFSIVQKIAKLQYVAKNSVYFTITIPKKIMFEMCWDCEDWSFANFSLAECRASVVMTRQLVRLVSPRLLRHRTHKPPRGALLAPGWRCLSVPGNAGS